MMNHKIGDKEAEEEDVFLFPQSCSGLHSPIPEGDKLERTRRRKKVKGAVEGGIGPIKNKLTAEQVSFLERNFELEQKLDCGRKDRLAAEVGLDPRQVAVWFQNRRSRWKSKQLEEEYHKLKSAHEFLLIEKSQLQAEVCNLKEQLLQAQLEIQRLNAQAEGVYANGNMHGSPLSSMSPDNASHPHVGGFGVEELDDYSLSLNVNMDS